MLKGLIYVSLFALVFCVGAVVCPPTDVPPTAPPPPTAWEPTPSSAPTETPEWTGTPWLQTQYPTPTDTQQPPVTETVRPPMSEPTPDPTATDTPGVPGTPEKHGKPTPTWDCNREYNPEKCLAPTGIGDLRILAVIGAVLAGVIVLMRVIRYDRAH